MPLLFYHQLANKLRGWTVCKTKKKKNNTCLIWDNKEQAS